MNLVKSRTLITIAVVMGLVSAACSGSSQADDTIASPEETVTTEPEATTTTSVDVLPEFAEATRPSLDLPDHSEYPSPGDAVVETYLNFVRAQLYAFGAPEVDPEYGPWLELTTGTYQENTIERMEEWREKNWVQVLPEDTSTLTNNPVPRPGSFAEVEGEIIGIDDCYVNPTSVVNRVTGEVIAEGTVTYDRLVEMTFTDGRWKVSGLAEKQRYEGVSECPEQ